jgi:phage shock protein C
MAVKKETFKRLFRSETNRVLAGVAGGLGEYFQIDPTIIRLIFVLLTVFGGGGVLVYIILWILIPGQNRINTNSEDTIKENAEELKNKAKNFAQEFKRMPSDNHPRNWFGFIIIVLGLLFLFDNLGFLRFHLFWPVLLIALGLFLLFR